MADTHSETKDQAPNARARALLDGVPECWRRCGVRSVNEEELEAALLAAEQKGWRDAAHEARRYSALCPDYIERSILLGMPR